jgi:hypothetical protein
VIVTAYFQRKKAPGRVAVLEEGETAISLANDMGSQVP